MCLPSRTATLFGRHPFETGIYDHSVESRDTYNLDVVNSLPTFIDDFWAAGDDTFGAGKLFSGGGRNRFDAYHVTPFYVSPRNRDEPRFVDRFDPAWIDPYQGSAIGDGTTFDDRGIDFGPSGDAPWTSPDGGATAWACDVVRDSHEAPFFLGLGIVAPHVPWRLPQQFFDLHPLDEVQPPPYLPGDEPVSLVDMGPTLTAVARVPMSEASSGANIVARVAEPARFDEEPPVMTWLEGNHAVRKGTWRYIRYSTGEVELYDLATDPEELTNLADAPEHAARIAELDADLPPPTGAGEVADATSSEHAGTQPDLDTMLSDPWLEETRAGG